MRPSYNIGTGEVATIVNVMALVASHLIGMGNSESDLTKARAVIETAMGVVLLRLMAMLWALSPIEGH